jgi:hypothetical protein
VEAARHAEAGTAVQVARWPVGSSSPVHDNEALLWLGLGAHLTKMAYTVATARRLIF